MSICSIVPVILSGGSGTRLWPLSRKLYPKQFIPLDKSKSLFQSTVERTTGVNDVEDVLVVCNDEHRFMVAEQLRQSNVKKSDIILEPVGRNTAPAITIAAIHVLNKNPDAQLLVLPADHIVADLDEFHSAVTSARQVANDMLVTFGVVPSRAETGFGYIKLGKKNSAKVNDRPVYHVDEFVEKPDRNTAEDYLASGNYLWNSGMFLFRADVYLDEIKTLQPGIFDACSQAYEKGKHDLDFIRLDELEFSKATDISVDYAVMEKTAKAAVIPLGSVWSDVGSWRTLWESSEKDSRDNTVCGDVVEKDCSGCYIRADHRLVTVVGAKDQVIVETADAVLVVPHDRVQEVKDVVGKLRQRERSEVDVHPRVHRPWGTYETVDVGDQFQVKRITVYPGQELSLQMHHHRAEHWVVVKGTAKVTRGDDEFLLGVNESTYIPIGTRHRLSNPGTAPLELIEVQSGTYLGEDDITRFDDIYGRTDDH